MDGCRLRLELPPDPHAMMGSGSAHSSPAAAAAAAAAAGGRALAGVRTTCSLGSWRHGTCHALGRACHGIGGGRGMILWLYHFIVIWLLCAVA